MTDEFDVGYFHVNITALLEKVRLKGCHIKKRLD